MADGSALPADGTQASLLLPMGRLGPAFLAYENFDVYTQWNQSLVYATTAAYFATRLAGAPPLRAGSAEAPSREQVQEAQKQLQQLGYDVGKVDGVIGAQTRAAVKAVQQQLGLPADSYPDPTFLAALGRCEDRGLPASRRGVRSLAGAPRERRQGGGDPGAWPRRDAGKHAAARRGLRARRHPLSRAAGERETPGIRTPSSRRSRRTSRGCRRRCRVIGALVDRLAADGLFAPTASGIIGFSQGACLTSEFIARNARRYGMAGVLTGGLIGPPGTPRNYPGSLDGTPVFLGSSDIDAHVPLERVHETRDVLTALGANVDERIYPGMGHTVNDDEVKAVTRIARCARKSRRGLRLSAAAARALRSGGG